MSWLILTVHNVQIFQTCKVMEAMLNYISIYHFLIGLFYFLNLFLHLTFKYFIKIRIGTLLFFSSHFLFLLETFIHKHFKSRKLNYS